jgi:LysM repeat protein
MVTLIILLFVSSAFPSLNHISFQAKKMGFIQAYGSSDPIATGVWQQDQYDAAILQESQSQGLNPFVVKGLIMVESGFDTNAISLVLNAACGYTHDEGLMQVNPICSATGSANLFDPWTNLYYGTKELASAYAQLGDMSLAIQAYNIGVPQVRDGGRNWAYYNEVMGYAQQFENEHCNNFGCSSPFLSTSSTSTTSATNSVSAQSCQFTGHSSSTYVVQQGDTLECISQKTGVSFQTIASLNGMAPPYLVYVGEVLHLAGSTPINSQNSPNAGSYVRKLTSPISGRILEFRHAVSMFTAGQGGLAKGSQEDNQQSQDVSLSLSNQFGLFGAGIVFIVLIAGNVLLLVQKRVKVVEKATSKSKNAFSLLIGRIRRLIDLD